jgi:hypothetical protein
MTPGVLLLALLTGTTGQEMKQLRQDFRGSKVNEKLFRFTSPSASRQMKVEPEGLRITLPGDEPNPSPTGIIPRCRIRGDCEITLAYELLRADKPLKGSGVGVSLYLTTDTSSREAVMLTRSNRQRGNLYTCDRMTTNGEGKRQFINRIVLTETRRGQLRLVRRGAMVTCLVAEDASDEFRELHQYELGTEEIVQVRAAADNGKTMCPLEVRFHTFEVRAQELADEPAPLPPPVQPTAGPSELSSSTWQWPLAAVQAGFAVCLVTAGAWIWRRRV